MITQPKQLRTPDTVKPAAFAAALLLAAGALTAHAGPTPPPRASKSESAGVAGGFAVGAAAGGPIGALVGAAAGGWLGDRLHREKTAHERTRAELATAMLRGRGLTMHLMFRTDDARLRPDDEALVVQFAALAATTPETMVYVTGFADPRGAVAYNAELAAARAAGVAARLVAAGMPAAQLVVSSETSGALPLADTPVVLPPDLDGYAFQRRVTLRIGRGSLEGERVAQQR